MIFQFQESFVEIVRERPYKNVLTVMATTPRSLREFYVRTPSNVLPVTHHIYKAMIHISDSHLPFDVSPELLENVEVVERLTAPPISYYCEYAHPDLSQNMTFSGRYCWADELLRVETALRANTSDMIGEPLFIPLFRVPMQLIQASNKHTKGDSAPEQDTPN
jgi:hypothetical protein